MKIILAEFSLGSMLFIAGCCNPANIGSQPVNLDAQQTGMWCWAASGKMTMDFLHPPSNIQECDEANKPPFKHPMPRCLGTISRTRFIARVNRLRFPGTGTPAAVT